jgi:hypothetical protein
MVKDPNDTCHVSTLLKQAILKDLLNNNYIISEFEIIETYKSLNYLKFEKIEEFDFRENEKIIFYKLIDTKECEHYLDSINSLNKLTNKKINLTNIKIYFYKKEINFVIFNFYNVVELYRITGFLINDKAELMSKIKLIDTPKYFIDKIHSLISK